MLKIWFAATILCASLFANHATSGDPLDFPAVPGVQPPDPNPGSNSAQQRGFWQYRIPDNNPIFPVPNRPNSHYMILGTGDYQTQSRVPDVILENTRQRPFYLPDSMSPSDAFGKLPGYLVFVYQPPELYHEMQSSSQVLKESPKRQRMKDVEEDDVDMGDLMQFQIECEKVNPNEKDTIRVGGFDFACKYSKKQLADKKRRLDVIPMKKAIPRVTPKLTPKVTPKLRVKPTAKSTPKPIPKAVTKTVRKPAPSPPPTKAAPKPKATPKPKPKLTPRPKPVEKAKRKTPVKPARKTAKKAPVKQRKIPQKKRNVKPRKGQRKPRGVPVDKSVQINDECRPKLSTKTRYEARENSITKEPYMEFLVHQFLAKIIYKNPDGTTTAPNHFYLECSKQNDTLQRGIYNFACIPVKIYNEEAKPKVWTTTTTDYLTVSPSSQDPSDAPNIHAHGSRLTSTAASQSVEYANATTENTNG